MEKKDLIQAVSDSLDRAESESFEELLVHGDKVQQWQSAEPDEVKNFINETFALLKEAIERDLLASLPITHLNSLNGSVSNFLNQYQKMKGTAANQVTNQHHGPLNQLNSVNNILRSSGLFSYIRLSPDIDRNSQLIKEQLSDVTKAKTEVVQLTEQVRGLLNPSVAHALSNAFDARREKVARQKWFWIGALIVGVIGAVYITQEVTDFLRVTLGADAQKAKNIPIISLLRLLLVIPIYAFIGFSFSQFRKERHFEENYAHKSSIAQTLPSYSELIRNPEIGDQITESMTRIVFAPPTEDEKDKTIAPRSLKDLREFVDSVGRLVRPEK